MKFLPHKTYGNSLVPAFFALSFAVFYAVSPLVAQPVTGVWRGKITSGAGLAQRTAPVEVKLVASVDSIVGTTYYYKTAKNYIRYSLKGYFNQQDGSVTWQDYYLVEIFPKKTKDAREYSGSMKFTADYSCPDGKSLRLDGSCKLPGEPEMKLELKKVNDPMFPDEWDELIDGYYVGMNRKDVVDSVWAMVSEPVVSTEKTTLVATTTGKPVSGYDTAKIVPNDVVFSPPLILPPPSIKEDTLAVTAKTAPTPVKPEPSKPAAPVDITADIAKSNAGKTPSNPPPKSVYQPPPPKTEVTLTPSPNPPVASGAAIVTVEKAIPDPVMAQAFTSRKKVVQTEIPVSGDTLELRFYDNAEVDGDSISLFMNGVALFQHVRLEVRPYIFKIPLNGLPEISELTMVAENLGAIPPNTAYMEAFVKGQRYTARLESTESSSGVVRLVRRE